MAAPIARLHGEGKMTLPQWSQVRSIPSNKPLLSSLFQVGFPGELGDRDLGTGSLLEHILGIDTCGSEGSGTGEGED